MIGEAPSRGVRLKRGRALLGGPSRVLTGCYDLAGGDVPEGVDTTAWFSERFRTVNLFEWRDAAWSAPEARKAASVIRLREIDLSGDRVILLGRRVAAAMGAGNRDFFDSWTDGPVRYWLIPHPSGRSRVMNDPETRRRVGVALHDALCADGIESRGVPGAERA